MTHVLADRYELGDVIGAGGMAKVRVGTDRVLGRRVAIKVLDDDAARTADPANRDRFLNEARTAAAFTHPNAVAVYDAGEDAGVLYIVFEMVDGESLASKLAREAPLAIDEAVGIAGDVLAALDAMHRAEILHRDVKPANVMIDRAGNVKLTDFGIAKRLDDLGEALTGAGSIIGTPQYLAPEQAVGDELGPPTDVYLVGALLHEMLTGRRPPSVIVGGAGGVRSPRSIRPDIPGAIDDVVVRSLAFRPSDRFRTAAEMATALRAAALDGDRPEVTTVLPMVTSSDDDSGIDAAATGSASSTTVDVADEIADETAPATDTIEARPTAEATSRTALLPEAAAVGAPGRSRPRRWIAPWVIAGMVAVAFAVLAGVAIRSVADGDRPSAVAPRDGDEFLAELRRDPGQFGDRGDDLRDRVEDTLQETDPDRRAEALESLRVDVFVWVAEGDLDTSVGALVDDLFGP